MGRLDSGAAQKLSGKLMWATQHLFFRVGRAMIKPLFAQKTSHTGVIGPRLLRALRWWHEVLSRGVSEARPWKQCEQPPCRLFVDAASTPARLAGVLFCDGRVHYFDGAPSDRVMEQLARRSDKQITSLVWDLSHSLSIASRLCASAIRRYLQSWSRSLHSSLNCRVGASCCIVTTRVRCFTSAGMCFCGSLLLQALRVQPHGAQQRYSWLRFRHP